MFSEIFNPVPETEELLSTYWKAATYARPRACEADAKREFRAENLRSISEPYHKSLHPLTSLWGCDGASAACTISRQAGTAQVAPTANSGLYMAPQ